MKDSEEYKNLQNKFDELNEEYNEMKEDQIRLMEESAVYKKNSDEINELCKEI